MLINDFITKDNSLVDIKKNIKYTLKLAKDFGVSHIPVFEGKNFVGSISTELLKNLPKEQSISNYKADFENFFILESNTIFDAINLFNINESNILPVLNNKKVYLGYLLAEDIIAALSTMPTIAETGAIMVVEISQKQFSISEVAKIVESNNAHLLGVLVTSYIGNKLQISIKLNSQNLSSVSETFERFGYRIVHKFFNDEKQELLKDRFAQLMKYLEV